MNFGTAIKTCFNKYADFDGRAGRSEYWFFTLFIILVWLVLYIATFYIAISTLPEDSTAQLLFSIPAIWMLAVFIPHLAVGVRRLHDVGKSGWWLLLQFTVIGAIPLVVWFASEGTTKGYTGPTKRRTSSRDYDDAPKQRSRSGKADLTDELEELQELYEDGTLSEAQFKKAKNKLLK